MKVINNCNSEVAEKILNLLDSEGKEPLSEETQAEIRALLASDSITGKEVPEEQHSKCMSILALIAGCSVFSACLYYTPIWIEETQVNAMELAEVSSVVACITTATILLGYTW